MAITLKKKASKLYNSFKIFFKELIIMSEFFSKNKKLIPVAAGVILFLCAGLSASLIFPSNKKNNDVLKITESKIQPANAEIKEPEIKESEIKPEIQPEIKTESQKSYVYVTGAVMNPGVYEIPENARIFHAIEAAGGFNDLAARNELNLAEELSDGTHIHVQTKSEVNKKNSPLPTPAPGVYVQEIKTEPEPMIASKNTFFIMDTTPVSKTTSKKSTTQKTTSKKSNKNSVLEKVDINRASISELEKLKGIGPALAKRIYEYRQLHGSFKSVEELVNVKGIGAAKLKAMRDQIVIR